MSQNLQKTYQTPTTLRHEINRIVDNHLHSWVSPYEDENEIAILSPHIEVSESDSSVDVSAELPGLDEKDIDVQISDDGFLTLTGEKKSQNEEKSKGYYFSERSYGMVQRTIPLPSEINSEKATADFENGVLSIHIPKLESAKKKVKKIAIKKK